MTNTIDNKWSKLNEFAEKNDICDKLSVGTIPVWILVKEDIFNYINEFTNDNQESKLKKAMKNLSFFKRFKRIYKSLKLKNINEEIDILFISSSQFRRGSSLSKYDNIYFADIIEYLPENLNYKIIDLPSFSFLDFFYEKSTNTDEIIPTDYWTLKSFLSKKFGLKDFEQVKNNIDMLDYSMFTNYEKKYIKETFFRTYISYYYNTKILGRLIADINPKVIVEVAGGALFSLPWIKDIPIIDIQHGIIHRYHASYSWNAYEKENLKDIYINRFIYCFSNNYKQILEEYGTFPQENIQVMSHPRLYNTNFKPRKKILNKLGINNEKIILISSQDIEHLKNRVLKFVKGLLPKLSSEYKVIIKLHPREYEGNHPYNRLEGVKLVTEEVKLMNLLNIADIHISCSSTIINEFMYFDKPNFILDNEMKFLFKDQIDKGRLKVIKSSADFINYLSNISINNKNNKEFDLSNPFLDMKDHISYLLE